MKPEPVTESDSPDNRSPFQRFEDLTRQLLTVPKAEVDAKLRKEKARRRLSVVRKPRS